MWRRLQQGTEVNEALTSWRNMAERYIRRTDGNGVEGGFKEFKKVTRRRGGRTIRLSWVGRLGDT